MNDWPPPSVEDAPSGSPTVADSTAWWRHPMTQALLVAWVVAGVIALTAIGFVRAVEPDAAMRPELTPATGESTTVAADVTSTAPVATDSASTDEEPTVEPSTDRSSTSTTTTAPLVRSAPPVPTTTTPVEPAATTTVVVTLPPSITVAPPSTVRIGPDIEVETNFDATDQPNGEWVRFTNVGAQTVDVTGWLVRDDGFEHAHVFASLSLEPGAAVTLYSGCGEPTITERYFCNGEVWNDDGDVVSLFDRSGVLIVQRRG